MKVLVIGANGAIGRMIVANLHSSAEFEATAFIRSEDQRERFESRGIKTCVASLEGSVDDIAGAMQGHDAIIFTAGSGAATGPDKTLTVDLDGAVKSMEAAVQVGIRRYLMVSALRAGDRTAWVSSPIKPYLVAKHYADRLLMSMNLDYTILRPGRLFDDAGTGRITVVNPAERKGVNRADVATLAVEVLPRENTFRKVIEFNEGDDPIASVVAAL